MLDLIEYHLSFFSFHLLDQTAFGGGNDTLHICLRFVKIKKMKKGKRGGKKCDLAREVICFFPTNDGLHFMQIGT